MVRMTQKLKVVRTKIVLEAYLSQGSEQEDAERIGDSLIKLVRDWEQARNDIISAEVLRPTVANR